MALTSFSNLTRSSGSVTSLPACMQLDCVQIDFTESENVWYIVILNVDMFIALGNCLIFAGIDCPLVFRILFGFRLPKPENSAASRDIQIASFAAEHDEIYSSSHDDVATIVCFFDRQHTGPSAIMNKCPLVDFLESRQPPQSESVYPSGLTS